MADRACVVLLREDHILLVQQRYRGEIIWTFPGGSIEPGETPAAAALREVAEETGLTVTLQKLLVQRPRSNAPGTYYCYLGAFQGEVQLGSDPELLAARWVPLSSVRTHLEVSPIWEQLSRHTGVIG